MKKLINNKLLLQILSTIIAVILWFAITYTEDPVINQTLTNLPLSFEGESALADNGFVIVDKDDIPDINVTIRGSRSAVISSIGSVSAIADVSKIISTGKNTVPVRYSYLSSGISLIKAKTTELEVNVERLISRDIPVKTEISGNNLERIIEPIVKNESITITGAESVVNKVSYAKAIVDLSSISLSGSKEYVYYLYGDNDNIIPEHNITSKSRNTINIENIVYDNTKLLPIKVVLDSSNRDDFGFLVKSIEKDTVRVGIKDDSVSIDHIDAVVKVDDSDDKYTATLVVPEGIYINDAAKTIWVTGEVLPKKIVEQTVDIKAINLPDGKSAIIMPKQLTVTLKTIEQEPTVTATVDISKMDSNEEQQPVNISTEADTEIIGSYNAFVKLTNLGE